MGDVIVVVPGIMGSTLRRHGRVAWAPTPRAVTTALGSLFRSITDLRLPDGIGDEHPGDGVEPVDLMDDIRLPLGLWTFDLGYTKLLARLRTRLPDLVPAPPHTRCEDGAERPPANLITFPYDWRLSNRYNGRLLGCVAERALERWRAQGGEHADAQLVFICHSMGGLVARWYLDHLGGAAHARKLITLGTPHRGALNALDQLVNGIRKGPGPFKLNLTKLARSLPSAHQLLPQYSCITRPGVADLARVTDLQLPELHRHLAEGAATFHRQIDHTHHNHQPGYDLHPIVGRRQHTATTATFDGTRLQALHTINGDDEGGDATVPRLAATPAHLRPDHPSIHWVADNHAGLTHNDAVLDHIEGILTATDIIHLGDDVAIAADVPDTLDPGETLHIHASVPGDRSASLEAAIIDTDTGPIGPPIRLRPTAPSDARLAAHIQLPGPGLYTITIQGVGSARTRVASITHAIMAWPPEHLIDPPTS